MADFFFFTDVDLLNSQTVEQAYGPAGVSEGKDRFRITSLHSATGIPNAYAICDGQVAVQQDSQNSNLINLILKPSVQPSFNISTISYIIYKGILKSSLIENIGEVNTTDITNNLTQSIKKSWDAYCVANKLSKSQPSEKALGINLNNLSPNFSDTDPIDNLFYQEESEFQFSKVLSGWKIGNFDPQLFGIEIIIESIGYEPKLSLARNRENYIEVEQYNGSNETLLFEHWHKKEEILNFYDPAAFFGSFYVSTLKIKNAYLNDEIIIKNDIHTKILKGTKNTLLDKGNFYNNGKVYLDIRNEHNQSFNYYKNYGNKIKLGINENYTEEVNYYQNSWPILILNIDSSSSDLNRINLRFPKGDNNSPILYVSQGYIEEKTPFTTKLNDSNKFEELSVSSLGIYTTKNSVFITPKNNTISICSYIKLRYFRKIDSSSPPPSSRSIRSSSSFDCIFEPFALKIPFKEIDGISSIRTKIYNHEIYIDKLSESGLGRTDYVANIGVSENSDSITFFAFAKDVNSKSLLGGSRDKISFCSNSLKSILSSDIAENNVGHFFNVIDINDSEVDLNRLQVVETKTLSELVQMTEFKQNTIGFAKKDYKNHFFAITFSKIDYNSMKSQADLNKDYRIFLSINKLISTVTSSTEFISDDSNKVKYQKFELKLKGFNKIELNQTEINFPDIDLNPINLYSLL